MYDEGGRDSNLNESANKDSKRNQKTGASDATDAILGNFLGQVDGSSGLESDHGSRTKAVSLTSKG